MLLVLRKALFYLLLLVYAVLMPYTLLYALGYIYNPVERGLLKTGLVSISTEPKSATIYVDGKKYSSKTPAAIRDLLPGRYTLRIAQKGYDGWQKEIQVIPEKATRFDPVVLLPLRPEEEVLSEGAYRGMVPAVEDFKIFAWRSDLPSLTELDLLFKKEVRVRKLEGERPAEITGVVTKPGSKLALLATRDAAGAGLYALDLARGRIVLDLKPYLSGDPEAFDWDPKNPDRLYRLAQGELSSIRVSSGQHEGTLARGVLGLGVRHNRLLLLKNDFSLIRTNERGENPEPLFEDRASGSRIFTRPENRVYRIEDVKQDLFSRDLLLFLGDKGTLLSNWLPYVLVDAGTRGFQYATRSGQEKVLYWTDSSLGVIDFSEEPGSLFERGPAKTVLVSGRSDIRQAFWAFEDSHILFLDGNRIELVEAGAPPNLVRPVAEAVPGSAVSYQESNRSLYYLRAADGRLVRRKITD